MLIPIVGSVIVSSLAAVYFHVYDKTRIRLYKLIETLQFNLKYHHRKGDTFYFKLGTGESHTNIFQKEQAFKDAFPDKTVVLDFDYYLSITVTEPLPEKINYEPEEVKGWEIPVGESVNGKVFHDFVAIPHILVAGMTRYGKSVLLKMLITSILSVKPQEAEFAILDLKGAITFGRFRKTRQTLAVAPDISESVKILRQVEKEIKRRMNLFLDREIESIVQAKGLKHLFVVVDEAAQLMSAGKRGKEANIYRDAERLLEYIAQIGGGLGVHLIYCTQYPTTKTIPQQVKANCDAVLSFSNRARSQTPVAPTGSQPHARSDAADGCRESTRQTAPSA